MDLSLVSESISSLLTVREYIQKISDLEVKLSDLSLEFRSYKNKVKSSAKAFVVQYNLLLLTKQHEIEQLRMV